MMKTKSNPTFKQFFKDYTKDMDVWNMGTLDYIKMKEHAKQIYDEHYNKTITIKTWR